MNRRKLGRHVVWSIEKIPPMLDKQKSQKILPKILYKSIFVWQVKKSKKKFDSLFQFLFAQTKQTTKVD